MFLRAGLFHLHVQDRKAGVRSSPRLEDHGQKRDGSLLCGYICQSEVSLLKQNKSGQAKDLIVIVRSGGGALQRDTALNCWGSWEATQVQPQRPTTELVPPSSLLSRARGDKGRLRHSLTLLFPSTPSPVHSCPGSAFSFNLYHKQPETKASYGQNIY